MTNGDSISRPTRVLVGSSDGRLLSLLSWTLAQDPRIEVVAQAASGDEVADCRVPFDVAVIDLAIGGIGILAVLRRLLINHPAPAVVVAAPTAPIYLRHAMAAEGAADYMVVPDDVDQLTERLLALHGATL